MQSDDDDPEFAAACGAENLKAALHAIPSELFEREDRIAQKQRLRNASAVSKTRDLQRLADEFAAAKVMSPFLLLTVCFRGLDSMVVGANRLECPFISK